MKRSTLAMLVLVLFATAGCATLRARHITPAEYHQVELGMTLEQVNTALGQDGRETSRILVGGTVFQTVEWGYAAEAAALYGQSVAELYGQLVLGTFEDGRLTGISQHGVLR